MMACVWLLSLVLLSICVPTSFAGKIQLSLSYPTVIGI